MTQPDDPLYEHLVRSQKCKKAVASLIKRFGVKIFEWAADQVRAENAKNKQSGRNKDFDDNALRDVWIYVESGKRQSGQSASKFCKHATFQWVSIGPGGVKIIKEIRGETLRRRYQEAVAYLRRESAPYKKQAKLRGSNPSTPSVSPVELWWRRALREYLNTLSGNPR